MLNNTHIKHMVDRFLQWKLPEHFNPDGGISFERDYNQSTPRPAKHEPVGTNLFTAEQAAEMVRFMLEGLALSAPQPTDTQGSGEAVAWRYSINYGPDGEEEYANVYDGRGALVGNLRTHHAIAVCNAMADERTAALEFQTGTPGIAKGSMRRFIALIVSKHSGKDYVSPLYYLNGYPLEYEECICGADSDAHDDGCPTTGWFYDESNFDYESCYHPVPGDVVSWAELPSPEAARALTGGQ